MQRNLLQLFYLLSAILFILGLRGLSHPRTARRGMFLAELGMLLAIIGTLLNHEIVSYRWIAAGLVLGTAIGVPLAMWIPMTAVPQRTALVPPFCLQHRLRIKRLDVSDAQQGDRLAAVGHLA